MSRHKAIATRAKFALSAAVIAVATGGYPARAAEDFTAGAVLDKMTASQQYTFLAGVIEGLAYSRYHQDNKNTGAAKDTKGMGCIYKWFYEGKPADRILTAFARFRDHLPGAVVQTMVKRECGDW